MLVIDVWSGQKQAAKGHAPLFSFGGVYQAGLAGFSPVCRVKRTIITVIRMPDDMHHALAIKYPLSLSLLSKPTYHDSIP
jgi:hypothetical protein